MLNRQSKMTAEEIITKLYPLPQESLIKLAATMTEVTYPRRYVLHHEDRRENKSFIIKEGLVRAFSYKNGKEVTFWLGKEGDYIFPLSNLFAGGREYNSVELLEDSVLYEFSLSKVLTLYEQDIHIANWGRRYAEAGWIDAEKTFILRQFETAAERYAGLRLVGYGNKIITASPGRHRGLWDVYD